MIGRTCWVFVVACFVVLCVFSNGLHERAKSQTNAKSQSKSQEPRANSQTNAKSQHITPIGMVSGMRPPHVRLEASQQQNKAAVRVLHLDWLQEELLFQSYSSPFSSPFHTMENRSTSCSLVFSLGVKPDYCNLGGNFRGQDEVHPQEDICQEAWPVVQLCRGYRLGLTKDDRWMIKRRGALMRAVFVVACFVVKDMAMRYAKGEVDDEPKKDELKGTQHRDRWHPARHGTDPAQDGTWRIRKNHNGGHSGEICFNWHTCEYCGRPSPGIPFARCNFCGARPSWHHGRCCPWREWPPRTGCTNPKEDGLAQDGLAQETGWGIQPVAPPKQPSFSNTKCACCGRVKGYEKQGWTQCGHPHCHHKFSESCPNCIMGRMPDLDDPEDSRPVCKCCWDPVDGIM